MRSRWAARIWGGVGAAGAVLVATLTGCGGTDAPDPGVTLRAEDFRGDAGSPTPVEAQGPAPGATPAGPSSSPRARAVERIDEATAGGGLLDLSSSAGAPAAASPEAPTAPPAGAAVTVDSLVGQINGQPVFASAFLAPLEGKLRAEAVKVKEAKGDAARRTAIRAWTVEAKGSIDTALRDKVRDELLLSEAYASLTPEQKEIGLRVFLNELRQDLVRRNQGSEAVADERLREQEGLGVGEKAKDQLDKRLIYEEINKRVLTRVNVSYRDIQNEYDRNPEYHPPKTAKLRMVRVPESKPASVEKVKTAIAAGRPIAEVAALPENTYAGEGAGLRSVKIEAEYKDAQFFSVPALNAAAQGLEPGGVAGPIALGGEAIWLGLEAVEAPAGPALYDVQLKIETALRDKRYQSEYVRYMSHLLKRGSYSDVETMVDRLVKIAVDRYIIGSS